MVSLSPRTPNSWERRTLSWHLPQVCDNLWEATDEVGFSGALIRWIPWQSAHEGDWLLPRATALPCTLVSYSPAIFLWQLPHVAEILLRKMGEAGSSWVRTSWLLWQSVHTAARVLPSATAVPWTLSW